MPFCTHCGNEVDPRDQFCARCGGRQPVQPPTSRRPEVLQGVSPRAASILCYIPTLGWIAAVIVLATCKFRNDRFVRFHAFQGLYLFAAWLVVQWVLKPAVQEAHIGHVFEMVIVGISIFMMVKAAHQEAYALPLIGELAQRSAAER